MTLVSSDDDPTAELEVLDRVSGEHFPDQELEADAKTFDCDYDEIRADEPSGDVAFLRRQIRLRDESIDRLQFDIEQLRARWNGLDKEIKVREKLTDNVNSELRQARNELAATKRGLAARESEVDALFAKVSQHEKSAAEFEKLSETLRDSVADRERRISELEESLVESLKEIAALSSKLADTVPAIEHSNLQHEQIQLTEEIEALRRRVDASGDLLASKDKQLVETDAALQESKRRFDELAVELADRDELISKKSAELENTQQQLDQTQSTLIQMRRETTAPVGANDGSHDLGSDDTELSAEQTGILVDNRQQIRELQSQVTRTEAYADSLRIKLQDQVKAREDSDRNLEQTETALADAMQKVDDLAGMLEIEKLQSANLRNDVDNLKKEFDQEVLNIRFELGAAQQTIAESESINEQLTSDLIDNQSFRQALESQLERSEESYSKTIRELRQKVRRLEHLRAEDQHKISNKDNAIAALLSELTSRNTQQDGMGNIEVRNIPDATGRVDDRPDEKSTSDRITRLLIGDIDGQELRFPLFKDRLTIGRTTHNDIQLKAQYISRRHALIVTENEHTRIVDWGSKNGIAVNKKKVTEHTLENGDIVTIGTAEFRYEERAKR
ncbi:MAG: FHA domain-containing protein [Gammaproteobacteria bacterium]|nr:FHA domain-containing protein [Gammaproteobacteria bacterium]MDH4314542.1 FHA domain-containing protein [Gammaproteobacteria bacterium]MDH5213977.1 FHA domain-containing protein [Gammaproteobacteria bacterium]